MQLWNIFGRAHKKRRKTEIITWWQNIISSLGKNFAVVWRRFRWLGKCLKNYEKCVAKKRRATFFGQQGGLCHENGVWHENVKNKKKPKKLKAKMWKKANKWSCCLGLNLAGETTLQIVWPMCAWCAKWGFFEGAINGEVSECLNRWGERFWQPLFGVLHSALFTGLVLHSCFILQMYIFNSHFMCMCMLHILFE